MTMRNAIFRRFLKGFVSGGIASAVLILQSGVLITSFSDLKQLGGALAVAFVTGGLLAIEKALNWETTPQM